MGTKHRVRLISADVISHRCLKMCHLLHCSFITGFYGNLCSGCVVTLTPTHTLMRLMQTKSKEMLRFKTPFCISSDFSVCSFSSASSRVHMQGFPLSVKSPCVYGLMFFSLETFLDDMLNAPPPRDLADTYTKQSHSNERLPVIILARAAEFALLSRSRPHRDMSSANCCISFFSFIRTGICSSQHFTLTLNE